MVHWNPNFRKSYTLWEISVDVDFLPLACEASQWAVNEKCRPQTAGESPLVFGSDTDPRRGWCSPGSLATLTGSFTSCSCGWGMLDWYLMPTVQGKMTKPTRVLRAHASQRRLTQTGSWLSFPRLLSVAQDSIKLCDQSAVPSPSRVMYCCYQQLPTWLCQNSKLESSVTSHWDWRPKII